MKSSNRAPVAGLVLAAGSLLLVATASPPAYSAPVSQAPGKPGKPDKPKNNDKPSKKPDRAKPDRRAPAAPSVGSAWAGAGGAVSVPVSAESGSRVVIRERGGGVVASGTGSSTYGWSTSTGSHSYVVTATDRAGNRSAASRFTVTADATPPRLSSLRVDAGDRSDSRSRLTFVTEPGSGMRVYVDGRLVRARFAADARVAMLLDVSNGRHQVRVEVRDRVRNLTTTARTHRVHIGRLRLGAELLTDPTVPLQKIRLVTSPSARRGVVEVPGQPRERFALARGRTTVRLALEDGSHDGIRFRVRDGGGRIGQRTIGPVRVDTTRPVLRVVPDGAAAEDGALRAAVTTDPRTALAWRLIDGADGVVSSGRLGSGSGSATIERNVPEGTFQLVVSATDEFGRTTTTSTATTILADPVSTARLAATVAGVTGGGVVLGLLGVPLFRRLLRQARKQHARVTAWKIDRAYERSLFLWDESESPEESVAAEPVPASAVVPPQRDGRGAVAALLEGAGEDDKGQPLLGFGVRLELDERVLHAARGQLYESLDGADELVLDRHDGELVVTNRRILFAGDVTRDWWTGLIDGLRHVGEDQSVIQRWREESWSGLVYDDPRTTRLYLDLLMAEQEGHRHDYLAGLESQVRATES